MDEEVQLVGVELELADVTFWILLDEDADRGEEVLAEGGLRYMRHIAEFSRQTRPHRLLFL